MGDGYRKEFDDLTTAAKELLRNPDVHLPHLTRLLRIWQYHSFDSWVSLLVYVPVPQYEHSDAPVVLEVNWDRPFDAMRFNDPLKRIAHGLSIKPTITIRQGAMSRELLDSLMSSLQKIALPVTIDRSIVLDGTELGLETFGMLAAMNLSWQPSMKAWSSLTEWANETRTQLTTCI